MPYSSLSQDTIFLLSIQNKQDLFPVSQSFEETTCCAWFHLDVQYLLSRYNTLFLLCWYVSWYEQKHPWIYCCFITLEWDFVLVKGTWYSKMYYYLFEPQYCLLKMVDFAGNPESPLKNIHGCVKFFMFLSLRKKLPHHSLSQTVVKNPPIFEKWIVDWLWVTHKSIKIPVVSMHLVMCFSLPPGKDKWRRMVRYMHGFEGCRTINAQLSPDLEKRGIESHEWDLKGCTHVCTIAISCQMLKKEVTLNLHNCFFIRFQRVPKAI